MHERNADAARARLRQLHTELRAAIAASLMNDLPHLAVALDIARGLVEAVLDEDAPKRTRIAMATAHADLALEVWRETIEATLMPTAGFQA